MHCTLCNKPHPKDQACSMRDIQEWKAIRDKDLNEQKRKEFRGEAVKEKPLDAKFDRSKFMKEQYARRRARLGAREG